MSGKELTLIFNRIDNYIQDSNSEMHRLRKPIQDYDKTVSKVNVISRANSPKHGRKV